MAKFKRSIQLRINFNSHLNDNIGEDYTGKKSETIPNQVEEISSLVLRYKNGIPMDPTPGYFYDEAFSEEPNPLFDSGLDLSEAHELRQKLIGEIKDQQKKIDELEKLKQDTAAYERVKKLKDELAARKAQAEKPKPEPLGGDAGASSPKEEAQRSGASE